MVTPQVFSQKLRTLDLFAGIGGFTLGLERAGGFRPAGFVEIDRYCRQVLAKHWLRVPCWMDIRTVRSDELPAVDLICGGFPCTDLSVAGKGAGLDGEASGLWFEMARIIRDLRPTYVLVENVAVLASRGLGRVVGDLAEIGYDCEWHCLPASSVGAPHRRDRIWIIAYPCGHLLRLQQQRLSRRRTPDLRAEGQALFGDDGPKGDVADADRWRRTGERKPQHGDKQPRHQPDRCGEGGWRDGAALLADAHGAGWQERGGAWEPDGGKREPTHHGEAMADAGGSRLSLPEHEPILSKRRWDEGRAIAERGWWRVEPDVGRVATGVPDRVDRLRALGNSLVPQIAEVIGRAILAADPVRRLQRG